MNALKNIHGEVIWTRAERLAQIQAGVERGLTHRDIAQELGVSLSTVRNILSDPDGSKQQARRERYRGTCVDCGGPTDGSNGPNCASVRCLPCHTIYAQTVLKVWTREAIIDAIRRFVAEHGRTPCADEWIHTNPAKGYPARSSMYGPRKAFASWNDAMAAAGFEPRPIGKYERTPEIRAKSSASARRRAAA